MVEAVEQSLVERQAVECVGLVANFTPEDEEMIQLFGNTKCKYILYGRETAPTTGMRHLQGYFQTYDLLYRRNLVSTIVNGEGKCILNYLQPAKGSLEDNRN